MSAVNHYVEVGQKWIDGQIKIGQSWFETMQGLEKFDLGLIWGKTIEAYQASIQSSLDAEVAGTKIWFEEVVPVNNLPQTALDVVKQMQSLTEEITKTQQTAADNWVNLLRQIDVKELPLVDIMPEQLKKPAAKATKKAS